jgi:hypothetical protein
VLVKEVEIFDVVEDRAGGILLIAGERAMWMIKKCLKPFTISQ